VKLSVIIVNYNVVYYLEQCLKSVQKAVEGIEAEVFVVDNNSVDGSCAMVRGKFPWVKLLDNGANLGFSKANNQAIALSRGQYVLLLNPDTVIQETTLREVLAFMDDNPGAGGLGVKMIDGKGKFLPESKRGLPTPWVAFCKIFGLSALFPGSRLFNSYHLGYLDKELIHEVDVLSGAFMLLRRAVLDEVGCLDEAFFMYGEDIDLSYRITRAGYKNFYFPHTTILHYKGQSTQKSSLNYVLVFYSAMKIFAVKHFSRKNARWYIFLINLAIYLRAAMALIERFSRKIFYPFCDYALIYFGFALFTPYWARYRYNDPGYDFPAFYYLCNVPAYAFVWISTLFLLGAYQKPISLKNTTKAVAVGSVVNFIIFAFLPDELRFSRVSLLFGCLWTLLVLFLFRKLLNVTRIDEFKLKEPALKRAIILGDEEECSRVAALIADQSSGIEVVGFVTVDQRETGSTFLGSVSQMEEIVSVNDVEEIIFCEKNISETQIISMMMNASLSKLDFKIAPRHSLFIVGNNSIDMPSSLFNVDVNSIASLHNRYLKRLIDVTLSSIAMVILSFCYPFSKRCRQGLKDCARILCGSRTFVGYNGEINRNELGLPSLKDAIINIAPDEITDEKTIEKINVLYAKNYTPVKDLTRIFADFRKLGN